MNLVYYALGAAFTFIGQVVYGFFQNNSVITLTNETVFNFFIVSAIAGLSFFLADYLMNKVSK